MKRVKRVDKNVEREYINKYRREWMDNEIDGIDDEISFIKSSKIKYPIIYII